jgi:hypothetical protein
VDLQRCDSNDLAVHSGNSTEDVLYSRPGIEEEGRRIVDLQRRYEVRVRVCQFIASTTSPSMIVLGVLRTAAPTL